MTKKSMCERDVETGRMDRDRASPVALVLFEHLDHGHFMQNGLCLNGNESEWKYHGYQPEDWE
jgi:hypothetical protein